MSIDDPEIIKGDKVKNYLNADDLDKLSDLFVNEVFPSVKIKVSETKVSVVNVLKRKGENINLREKIKSRRQYKEGTRSHLKEVLEKGNMVIAKKGDRVIGMVRIYKLENPKPNELVNGDIFEIGKAFVVPEERMKGIGTKIWQQAIAMLKSKYGNKPILAGTDQDPIKKICQKDGWREISFGEYLKIRGTPDEQIAPPNVYQQSGLTAFLYIPKED